LSGLESLVVRSSVTAAQFAGEVPDLKRIAAEADADIVMTAICCGLATRFESA
jgi:hypothetical protein